jgi:hypothetical protein
MKEKLECARCEQKWERERTRGRKPIFCPECTEINSQEEIEHATVSGIKAVKTSIEDSNRTYKFYIPAPSQWLCDHCDVTLKVNVGVIEVPMHLCMKRRSMSFPLIQRARQDAKLLSIGAKQ